MFQLTTYQNGFDETIAAVTRARNAAYRAYYPEIFASDIVTTDVIDTEATCIGLNGNECPFRAQLSEETALLNVVVSQFDDLSYININWRRTRCVSCINKVRGDEFEFLHGRFRDGKKLCGFSLQCQKESLENHKLCAEHLAHQQALSIRKKANRKFDY